MMKWEDLPISGINVGFLVGKYDGHERYAFLSDKRTKVGLC